MRDDDDDDDDDIVISPACVATANVIIDDDDDEPVAPSLFIDICAAAIPTAAIANVAIDGASNDWLDDAAAAPLRASICWCISATVIAIIDSGIGVPSCCLCARCATLRATAWSRVISRRDNMWAKSIPRVERGRLSWSSNS